MNVENAEDKAGICMGDQAGICMEDEAEMYTGDKAGICMEAASEGSGDSVSAYSAPNLDGDVTVDQAPEGGGSGSDTGGSSSSSSGSGSSSSGTDTGTDDSGTSDSETDEDGKMKIDIIAYTAGQLAALTEEQLQEVKSAQMKKNRLVWKRDEALREEKRRLVNNGMFFAEVWARVKAEIEQTYATEIEWVRDGLLFYLHYVQGVVDSAPYPLDYSLSEFDRVMAVREYYETTYTDPDERLAALEADTVAPRYLGESYKGLWQYYVDLTNKKG